MIKIEHVVVPSPEQMEFIIQGMRNPLNSWKYSDSEIHQTPVSEGRKDELYLGEHDKTLMTSLAAAGPAHRKFMRMMPIFMKITAPLYWWKEFDTYKVGTVSNSCSTMHKIAAKEFTLDDFSTEHLFDTTTLKEVIHDLNVYRDIYNNFDDPKNSFYKERRSRKDVWYQMIQLLPSSYNQTRNISTNYETLRAIYWQRRGHKLDEWNWLCTYIETIPYAFLITEEEEDDDD
jgi:hypothetical protein